MQTRAGVHPEQTLPAGDAGDGASPTISEGMRLGRYRVLHKVGAGSMGVVLAALDPELGRKVAIKILHAESERARAELEREAKALARLSHPNVVPVLDVGEHRGNVFVAMEFVEGVTLDVWLRREEPPPSHILEVFEQIGLGLAAAHDAGIVHRDVKPQNIMLGADGRARVMDFGLAAELAGSDATSDQPTPSATRSAVAPSLSRAQGTPAYMAPEQWHRHPASAKADQFAFCVALYEALWGLHPFGLEGDVVPRSLVERGATPPPLAHVRTGRRVPRALAPVVTRGLAYAPEDRHPSMQLLLAAMRVAGRRPRRGALWAGLGLTAFAGVVVYLATARPDEPPCATPADKLVGVWDDSTRAAVRESLRSSGTPYSEQTADRVVAELDDYAAKWIAARTHACEAATVAGEQTLAVMEARIRCLDGHRRQFRARAAALQRPGERVAVRAIEAVTKLPALQSCEDPTLLAEAVPPPADAAAAARADELRDELAEFAALIDTGAYPEARARAEELRPKVYGSEYTPLRVEFGVLVADLHGLSDEIEESVEMAKATYLEALGLGMDKAAAAAASTATYGLSVLPGGFEEGLRWAGHTRAALDRLGGTAPELETDLEHNLGSLYHGAGDLDRAREHFLRAVELAPDGSRQEGAAEANLSAIHLSAGEYPEAAAAARKGMEADTAVLGPEHPRVAADKSNLGMALFRMGRFEEAIAEIEGALRIRETAFGPNHSSTYILRMNLASIQLELGNHEAALERYDEARAALETSGHREDARMAWLLINVAQALTILDRLDEADVTLARAQGLWESALGVETADTTFLYEGIARLRMSQHRFEDAEVAMRKGVDLLERTLGPDTPRLAFPYRMLGLIATKRGELESALRHHERALKIHEASLGQEHLESARDHRDIGNLLVETGHVAEGTARLQRALELMERLPDPPRAALGTTRLALAEARQAAGDRPGEVARIAAQACDELRDDPGHAQQYERAVELSSPSRSRARSR